MKVCDEHGNAVPGVTVTGNWSGAATFTTGLDGWGQTATKPIRTSSTFVFCVTALAKNGYTYDASANRVTCGGSDGTVWESPLNATLKNSVPSDQADGEVIVTAYPNPFNLSTQISLRLAEAADVRLEIYNILGQKVVTLYDRFLQAGPNSVAWDARDDYGQVVGSGTYLYRLSLNNEQVANGKLLLIK